MDVHADASLRILGQTSLQLGGAQVEIRSAAARELLVLLALHRHSLVSTESLVDDLWGEGLPSDPVNALHSRVRKLRRALDGAGADGADLVRREGPGYRLCLEEAAVDAWRCESLVAAALSAAGASQPVEVLGFAESALGLWYGEAFADALGTESGQREAVRFESLRQSAEELRAEALLRLGRDQEAVGHLTAAVGKYPYHERFAGQLMLALYRTGRQSAALQVYGEVRTRLVEELGVDPGPELQGLELRILRQDAGLAAASPSVPSPEEVGVMQLLEAGVAGDVAHRKTDTFRELADYPEDFKDDLAAARRGGPDAVQDVEARLGPLPEVHAGIVVDLVLSYRAVEAWDDVCRVVATMAPDVAATLMVREQNAFALNRLGMRDKAAALLEEMIEEHGPSSESAALLGRVRKDQWADAVQAGASTAAALLEDSIAAYLMGFEADWRDAYPGVNALTLMEILEPPDPRRAQLRPLVRYAVERRLASPDPDYWDHATLLELAVLDRDGSGAEVLVARVRAAARESWEPATTARNLTLLHDSFASKGEATGWIERIVTQLEEQADSLAAL